MKELSIKISWENMISRIPGLFAYIDFNEVGEKRLHVATDSNDGCYGRIVENIVLPCYAYDTQSGVYVIRHGLTEYEYDKLDKKLKSNYVFNNETGINRRVMIDGNIIIMPVLYYLIENTISIDEFNNLNTLEKSKYVILFPALLKNGETYTYRTIIDLYYKIKHDGVETRNEAFINFIDRGIGRYVIGKSDKYDLRPEVIYLSNARHIYNRMIKMKKQCNFYDKNKGLFDNDKDMCCLCDKFRRMGGDDFIMLLENRLIPMAERIAKQYFNLTSNIENELSNDISLIITNTLHDNGLLSSTIRDWEAGKHYIVGDKVRYNNAIYICIKNTSGKYNNKTGIIEFDDLSFTLYDKEYLKRFYSGYIEKNEISLGNDNNKNIDGQTNSKLPSLRRSVVYLNDIDKQELPSVGYDWLFYYRKNRVVGKIDYSTDELGNILNVDYETANSADGGRLLAFGNYIKDIVLNKNEHTIKFSYIIGAHLKATISEQKVNEDKKIIYKWKNFTIDENSQYGIEYEETYKYEVGSDLDLLANDSFIVQVGGNKEVFDFNGYINGEYDDKLPTIKFEFITFSNSMNTSIELADRFVTYKTNISDYVFERLDDVKDTIIFNNLHGGYTGATVEEYNPINTYPRLSDTIKEEFYDNITYSPDIIKDVNIERGNTSAFERHIRLSEVKTLEDMVNFQNGSFFKMENYT